MISPAIPAIGCGAIEPERHDQFDDMVDRDAGLVDPLRQPVKIPAQWIGHRLRLEVVIQARQVAPAGIAAQLDQPGAEHQAEQDPSVHPDEPEARRGRGPAEEDGEKAGLEQERLPAESVEGLADVDEREIEEPQRAPDDRGGDRAALLGPRAQRQDSERNAGPRSDPERRIGGGEKEKARRRAERDKLGEARDGQQAALAEQRHELIGRHGERDEVHQRERALEQEARIPGRHLTAEYRSETRTHGRST